MRLLIAYDGSSCSDAALDDLARAGLPAAGEAEVLSVAEVWLPPTDDRSSGFRFDAETEERIHRHHEQAREQLKETEELSRRGRLRVEQRLPGWSVSAAATYGSPAWEILARADEFKPDLILVGSQGRSAIGRFVLGSISQKVLTEARCSVRIGRGRIEVNGSPVRLLLAFDSSEGAHAAAEVIASRNWPAGSSVLVVAAAEPLSPLAMGMMMPPVGEVVDDIDRSERDWLGTQSQEVLRRLAEAGLIVDFKIETGIPKRVILEQAEAWNADAIFAGANKFGSWTERFLLGSTSAAIAARAHCTVEVVRKNGPG
jgi:nucleotide-binding universal stress UspA family protein